MAILELAAQSDSVILILIKNRVNALEVLGVLAIPPTTRGLFLEERGLDFSLPNDKEADSLFAKYSD